MSEPSVTFNPSLGERLIRSRSRIDTLKAAILKEEAKDKPNKKRMESLKKELDRRVSEIKQFMEGIE